MENEIDADAPEGLKTITEWINNFCDLSHIPGCKYKSEYDDLLEMTYDEILDLSSEECFAKAILLANYSTFLQKKLGIMSSQLQWCEEASNFVCAKYWNRYDSYLPAAIKKQSIINDNSYLQQIEKYKIRIDSGVKMIQDSYYDIKKRIGLFESLGKSRSFK
jgi:hypothetical protein